MLGKHHFPRCCHVPAARPAVAITDITSIVMGQYSKVFRRNQTEMTEPGQAIA